MALDRITGVKAKYRRPGNCELVDLETRNILWDKIIWEIGPKEKEV